MKRKRKSKLLFLVIFTFIIVVLGITGYKLGFKDINSLTLEENKWIDENKHNVIDIAILNDIPVLSYDGDGLIYNYLDYVSDNHSLKFNYITYKLDGNVEYDYKIDIVNKISNNQIELYKDNLVMISQNNVQYNDTSDINNLRIGILRSDKDQVSNYINNNNITYVEFENYNDLKNSLISSTGIEEDDTLENKVDSIIILKTVAMKEIIENNLKISYHFNDLNRYFVLTTKGNKKLNNILLKTFNSWSLDNFETSYNEEILSDYYKFKKLSDVEQKTLKSKNYKYGFVNYGIYNSLEGKRITGLNGIILKNFNKFSGLSISYTKYNSITKLITDFNSGKIDFTFDLVDNKKIKNDVYETSDIFEKKLVIVSDNNNNNIVIDNLKSLVNKKVLTIKNSYIETYLKDNQITVVSYNNLEDLIKDFGAKDMVVIDLENYNYYKALYFKNSRINYIIDIKNNYKYLINNTEDNKLFESMFDFYLNYTSINKLISQDYNTVSSAGIDITYVLFMIIVILAFYVILDFSSHLKQMLKLLKKSNKEKLTKAEKIMYIDQLTSLKNRAYFNSKIEIWDESEVYPQSIIIIDLNNLSYVNDNYGREEGDKVIIEAANILIKNQISNSEIIRSDGNEFLIYLVGYTEKQIISYLRKLHKEFKNLSHGFGAASGYSIITDAIKTIDDAVNEATNAMKDNKEDIE